MGGEEVSWDIATKEARAIQRVLEACRVIFHNACLDIQVVIKSWQNQGGKSPSPNAAMKALFSATLFLNISLHLHYVPSENNLADASSHTMAVHSLLSFGKKI